MVERAAWRCVHREANSTDPGLCQFQPASDFDDGKEPLETNEIFDVTRDERQLFC